MRRVTGITTWLAAVLLVVAEAVAKESDHSVTATFATVVAG